MNELINFNMSIPVLIAIAGLVLKIWGQDKDLKAMSIKYGKAQREVEDRTLVLETEFKTHSDHYDELKDSIEKVFDRIDKLASEIRNGKP